MFLTRKFILLSFHLNVNIITKGFSRYSTIVISIHRINISHILRRYVLDRFWKFANRSTFYFLPKLLSSLREMRGNGQLS